MAKQAFTFIKKFDGGLTITLESYDFTAPKKEFHIPYNVQSIVVPYVFALGLFVSEGALTQLKLGYFEVKDYDKLVEAGAEHGLVASEEMPKINRFDRIRELMKLKNKVEIEKILKKGNPTEVSAIITCAYENRDNLSASIRKLIEDECGVIMTVEE